ncbi:TPA: cysteine--tRNA ligase [Candidatus Woesearchaeota archaeon]|nr:cysteine--tRNA ligase [Candidatus Woesearchaeota archaeon]HIH31213.1 cysteine--tRNA ligase [Candidatus Woesearchaeota archaeon]HIH55521.1 cysteine--tRNA ligase [Candidatus Woesearchaeota archaeon]HIJ02212.1 cysteine--tRNA ligase [Candidatus Woesearchaeota archaeon]HIJ13152.1 cysteine--tRNA ligase [Candidatus Woesearchaeota archaeon]
MMLTLFNTLSRKKEEFHPIHKDYVGLYTCGPTVYFFAHIGNLRTYVFEDLLKRVLLFNKFKVKHVMNITDVGHLTSDADEGEDKMLKGAKREGKTVWEIAKFYEDAFMKDMEKLNMLMPDIKCKATDHVQDMIDLIKRLEDKGMTYIANGNVYYDIMKFPHYGVLARLNMEELRAGARIEIDEHKRNPHDFVLWFTKSKFENQEMKWPSKFGVGYPGWHIECSAMSMKYLGEHFDIHCGGIDHIPVHHTNEIAQSEGATGHKWVNYWMHGEFLVMDKGKMSKSSGEILTLNFVQSKGYDPLDYRYLCLNTHYRTPLTFSFESLDAARSAFRGLKNKIIEFRKNQDKHDKSSDANIIIIEKYNADFIEAINDDLNMPKALAVLWSVVRDKDLSDKEKLHLIFEFDKVFGLDLVNVAEETIEITKDIQELVDQRQEARKKKDFKKADELRELIKEKGYSVDDSKDGIKVKKI